MDADNKVEAVDGGIEYGVAGIKDYLKELLAKLRLDYLEDTSISEKAEERRKTGTYRTKLG